MGKADSYNPSANHTNPLKSTEISTSELQTVNSNIQHKKKDLKRNNDFDLTNILSQINADEHSKSNGQMVEGESEEEGNGSFTEHDDEERQLSDDENDDDDDSIAKAFGDILVKIHEKTEELDQSKKRHEKQLEATEYVLRNILNIPELPRTLNDTEKQLAAADQEKRDLLSKSIFEKIAKQQEMEKQMEKHNQLARLLSELTSTASSINTENTTLSDSKKVTEATKEGERRQKRSKKSYSSLEDLLKKSKKAKI